MSNTIGRAGQSIFSKSSVSSRADCNQTVAAVVNSASKIGLKNYFDSNSLSESDSDNESGKDRISVHQYDPPIWKSTHAVTLEPEVIKSPTPIDLKKYSIDLIDATPSPRKENAHPVLIEKPASFLSKHRLINSHEHDFSFNSHSNYEELANTSTASLFSVKKGKNLAPKIESFPINQNSILNDQQKNVSVTVAAGDTFPIPSHSENDVDIVATELLPYSAKLIDQNSLLAELELLKMQNNMLTNRIQRSQLESYRQLEHERTQRHIAVTELTTQNKLLDAKLSEVQLEAEQELIRQKEELMRMMRMMREEKDELKERVNRTAALAEENEKLVNLQRAQLLDALAALEQERSTVTAKLLAATDNVKSIKVSGLISTGITSSNIAMQNDFKHDQETEEDDIATSERSALMLVLQQLEHDKTSLNEALNDTEATAKTNAVQLAHQLATEQEFAELREHHMHNEQKLMEDRLRAAELAAATTTTATTQSDSNRSTNSENINRKSSNKNINNINDATDKQTELNEMAVAVQQLKLQLQEKDQQALA